MKKNKALIIIISAFLLITLLLVGKTILNKKQTEGIAVAYTKVNDVISVNANYYIPFVSNPEENGGIDNGLYLSTNLYRQQTGIEFYYEDIVEYFLQEYEEDGSLRLYNNGLHPEMEAYVEWHHTSFEERRNYRASISDIYYEYFREHRDAGFESVTIYALSTEMLDELIKKEADPTYEMDLMSIQQRERAEVEEQSVA